MNIYPKDQSVSFFRTKEKWGGFSNMCGGFPLLVNDVPIRTSEALYQAMRFPHDALLQERIIVQNSPIIAKRVAQSGSRNTREDWMMLRVSIMRWALRVKLAQNFESFGALLDATEEKFIVEQSYRPKDLWSAVEQGDEFVGHNQLGKLLMDLRTEYREKGRAMLVVTTSLDLTLYNEKIGVVQGK